MGILSKRDLRTYGLYFLAWTVIGLFFFSEFVTGETTLALHPASPMNPAGAVELGFAVAGIQTFHKEMFAPEPILLPLQSQSELQDTRIKRRVDDHEVPGQQVAGGIHQIWPVERVEGFGAELNRETFHDPKILLQSKIRGGIVPTKKTKSTSEGKRM